MTHIRSSDEPPSMPHTHSSYFSADTLSDLVEPPTTPEISSFPPSATMPSPLPRFFQHKKPLFRRIGLVAGDPLLPDLVKPGGQFSESDKEDFTRLLRVLKGFPEYEISVFTNHATLLDDLLRERPDMVINICDNGYRNNARLEMHVPAMLDMLGIPYTGSGPVTLALAYDKALVGSTARAIGVPVPEEMLIAYGSSVPAEWQTYPAFVKPNCADNSFGILSNAVCHNRKELEKLIAKLNEMLPGTDLLVQEFLEGAEYRVFLLGNPESGFHAMPVVGVNFLQPMKDVPRFVTYEHKYTGAVVDASGFMRSFVETREEIAGKLCDYAIRLAKRFSCMDHTTFDFRMDAKGQPKFIDLNPNPAWDANSLVSEEDKAVGYSYEDIIRYILEAAQLRYRDRVVQPEVQATTVPKRRRAKTIPVQWRHQLAAADIPQLETLLRRVEVFTEQEIADALETMQDTLGAGKEAGSLHWILAERDGKMVAFANFGPGEISEHSYCCHWIVTDKTAQGSGVTSRLYEQVEAVAREKGAKYLYMETSSLQAFAPARRFYLKSGFVQVAELTEFYKPGDHKYIYRKVL